MGQLGLTDMELPDWVDALAADEVAVEKHRAGPIERRRLEKELANREEDFWADAERVAQEAVEADRRKREQETQEETERVERSKAWAEVERRDKAYEEELRRKRVWIAEEWQRKKDGLPAGTVDDPAAGDVLVDVLEGLGVDEDTALEAARFFDLAVDQIAATIAWRVADKLSGQLTRGIAAGTQAAVEQILDVDADRFRRAAKRREEMKEWGYELDADEAENAETMLETEQ